ncbi:MAG: hypothetical protein JEZ06_07295 [Anaerolineaceae bacterium]|nr:hypothetical protein [Anaerolineaceae bacterium]
MTEKLKQAYRQAPWRIQIQNVGLIMLFVVTGTLVAGLYLSVSAETYETSVEINKLEYERSELQRQIADLRVDLASNTSSAIMAQRAKDLGYTKPSPDASVYMKIPEYSGRQLEITLNKNPNGQSEPLLKPSYTQSLWEWVFELEFDEFQDFNGVTQ